MSYTPRDDGFAMFFTLGWLPFAVAAAAFLVAARPWRALGRSRRAQPVRTGY
jgi:hypothetical protein